MTRRVFALGECMVEMRQDSREQLSYGFAGDTLNTTTYLRRLLPEDAFRVGYVTAIGDDHLSDQMLQIWRSEGIDTEFVRRFENELPGLYWIRTDDRGERNFHYWRSAAAARQVLRDGFAERLSKAASGGDYFYLTGISLAILPLPHREELLALLAKLRLAGVTVAYDTNYRAQLWPDSAAAATMNERMLSSADIVITSHVDEAEMFGDSDLSATAQRFAASGVGEWVIRGEPGITVTGANGQATARPLDPRLVVDTTGAGDSFDAAYLAARLGGLDCASAVNAGHALASLVVQHSGAIIPSHVSPGLEELLRS
ncbi:MAG: sugar kinase [Woeseia sp.]